jgi:hypothetical protein
MTVKGKCRVVRCGCRLHNGALIIESHGCLGQIPCGGPDVFCPLGSREPLPVPAGHFTVGGRHNYTDPAQLTDCRMTYNFDLLNLQFNLQVLCASRRTYTM